MELQNKTFTELMTQPNRFAKFVRCVGDVREVAERMEVQEVLTAVDRRLILGHQMRLHQKDALVDTLARKKFHYIDRMIYALDEAESSSATVLMKTLKYLVIRLAPTPPSAPLLSPKRKSPQSPRPSPPRRVQPLSQRLALREEHVPLEELGFFCSAEVPQRGNYDSNACSYDSESETVSGPIFRPHSEGGVEGEACESMRLAESAAHRSTSKNQEIRNDVVLLELEDLQLKLEDIHILKELISVDEETHQTLLHACFLRSTGVLGCLELLLTRFEQLQKLSEDPEEVKRTVEDFINEQNQRKQTVAHLAAESSLVDVLLMLHKRRCNFFLKDELGFTAMKLMYLHAPEAVFVILNDAINPTDGSDPADRNFKVEFDFCTVIGRSKIQDLEPNEETTLLAELVNWSPDGSKLLLTHLAIKLFLELKWTKMKFWFGASLFIQLFLHLFFTLFVIQVFLIDCRHATTASRTSYSQNTTKPGTVNDDLPKHFYNYLLGTWTPVKQVLDTTAEAQGCILEGFQFVISVLLLISGGLLCFVKEMFALYFKGPLNYFSSLKSILQLSSISCISWVTSVAFSQTLTDSHYCWAATGVIISWSLILMRLGNFFGMGIYIQMLGKVIKRFLTMMCVYIVIIIAFSIAFSIMFPQEEPFKTLPRAISRVVIMMTGEFDYKETFYGSNTGGPPIPLPSHIMFGCFAILLTIILMNWLIGMIINDINVIKEKSEVILMSIKIDHISIMERSLIRISDIIVRRALEFCFTKTSYSAADLDIYVFPINQDLGHNRSNYTTVIEKRIKDIPKKLRKPLIHFATTGNVDSATLEVLQKLSHQLNNILPELRQ